jgi:uncharacterized protein YndB with AHSA1/START domain
MPAFSKTCDFEYPVEVVYATWISEKTVIAPTAKLVIEPRPGGVYRLIMSNDAVMNGIFSEVLPNRRLKYSWQWQGSDEITKVDVVFESRPDGSAVQLTHSGFQSSTSLDNHSTGWDSYIDGFSACLRESQFS